METIDFMDPKRRRQHEIMLFVGYFLIGVAILLISIILLFVAYGFGYKNGRVIQSGLVFISSIPNPAQIYINGVREKNDTNTKLAIPEGTYHVVLKRTGYRDWQRDIAVQGGQVESYTYPFLFPDTLTTMTKKEYGGSPSFVTESPDRQWLLVGYPAALTTFDLYNMNNPTKEPIAFVLPTNILPAGTIQRVTVVSWAGDNDHLLLEYTIDGRVTYAMTRRSAPEQSIDLSQALALEPDMQLAFHNGKYDTYEVYSPSKQTLATASLTTPSLQPMLSSKVLAYETYGDSNAVYVAPDATDPTKVSLNVFDNGTNYIIRRVAAGQQYNVSVASYNGKQYVVLALQGEGMAYLYENPVNQITNKQLGVAVPLRAFRVSAPNYIAFSDNAQYLLVEHGQTLAVYDAENDQSYTYTMADPLDQPQTHAVWMDGSRLLYVSKGQLIAQDYDDQNRQVLVAADPTYQPVFDQNYKTLYSFVPAAADKTHRLLTYTSLRSPADQ